MIVKVVLIIVCTWMLLEGTKTYIRYAVRKRLRKK